MTGRLLALLLAAIPAVCGADEADAILDRCLAEAPDRRDAEECRYLVKEACVEATNDETTIGLSQCLQVEANAWDERLNALWTQVVDTARAADAADQGGGTANEDALRAAQRAWIAFRDAECAWIYERWSGGSIRTLMAGSCQLEMTASRFLDFRDWLQEY